jgi:hypothetical protein
MIQEAGKQYPFRGAVAERCLRDLIAFTSLPLVWKDKPLARSPKTSPQCSVYAGSGFALFELLARFERTQGSACSNAYPGLMRADFERMAPFLELESEDPGLPCLVPLDLVNSKLH